MPKRDAFDSEQGGPRTNSIISIVVPIIELKVRGLVDQPVEIVHLILSPDRVRAVDVREFMDETEELVGEGGIVLRVLYSVQTSGVIHRWAVHTWVWKCRVREEPGAE